MHHFSSDEGDQLNPVTGEPSDATAGDVCAVLKFPDLPDHLTRSPLPASAERLYELVDTLSRRIDDLARELNCLGYFDDDDPERPRAA